MRACACITELSPRVHLSSSDAALWEISASFRAPTKRALPDGALTAGGTVSRDGRPVALSGAFDLTTSDFSVQRVLQLEHLPSGCFSEESVPAVKS